MGILEVFRPESSCGSDSPCNDQVLYNALSDSLPDSLCDCKDLTKKALL